MAAQNPTMSTSVLTGKVDAIGTVKMVIGTVSATSPDGVVRVLQVGDKVNANDVIQTGDLSSVDIEFVNGTHMDLGRNAQTVLDTDIFNPMAAQPLAADVVSIQAAIAAGADPTAIAAATAAGADVVAIQAAIAAGADPTAISAATAAGAGAASEGGHTFVQVDPNYAPGNVTSGFETDVVTRTFAITEGQVVGPVTPTATVTGVDVGLGGGTAMEGSPVTFQVSLSSPVGADTTVQVRVFTAGGDTAMEGADYAAQIYTVVIPAGSTSATFDVATVGDNLVEGNETFSAEIVGATSAAGTINVDPAVAAGAIIDNDNAVISVSDETVTEGNTATFTVTLSNPSTQTVTVDFATANGTAISGGSGVGENDYGSTSGTLTFAPGQTTATVQVTTTDDNVFEGTESFVLNLSNAANATIADNQGIGTILDNEPQPTLAVNDVTVNEDAGVAVFTVTLSGASATPVTVNYVTADGSATAGQDYTATSGSLTFAAGETSKTISVPITNDLVYEGNETFNVNLSGASGAAIADSLGLGTILDNDLPPPPPPPQNQPPVALDDSVTTAEDTPVTISVLANDSDVEGDPLTVISFTEPGNGTLVLNEDSTFTYTPNPDYNGEDSFSYTISDGHGGTSTATANVDVGVTPVNDPPVALDDAVTTPEDTPVTINVLSNDSDVEGDPLTVVDHTDPAHGTLVLNSDNTFTYTPNPDYNGEDSFSYTISDGHGGTSTATANVNVGVTPVNDAPVVVADTGTAQEDVKLAETGNVLANDSDIDAGTTLAVAAPGHYVGTYGTLDIAANGDYTYTLNNAAANVQSLAQGQTVQDAFNYAASDGITSTPSTLTITVTGTNDRPSISGGTGSVFEAGLAAGSQVGDTTTHVSGVFTLSDVDANDIPSITQVNGTDLTWVGNVATVNTADGQFVITNNSGAYSWDYYLNSAVDHAFATNPSLPVVENFIITVDDGWGLANSTNTSTVAINIQDDMPQIFNIVNGYVANDYATLSSGSLVNFTYGADLPGKVGEISGTAPSGLTYHTDYNLDGSAILHAMVGTTTTEFFNLHIATDGSYTVQVVTPNPVSTFDHTLLDLTGGSPVSTLAVPLNTDLYAVFTGDAPGTTHDTVNFSGTGLGVSNNSVDPGEFLLINFMNQASGGTHVDVTSVDLVARNFDGGDHVYWQAYNDGVAVGGVGTFTAPAGTNSSANLTFSVDPAGSAQFDSIRLWTDGEEKTSIKLQSMSTHQEVFAGDLGPLSFTVGMTDHDGDTTTALLNLTVEGRDASGYSFSGTEFADAMQGSSGHDVMLGLGGNDILVGGGGADTLSGGAGNDTFVYKAVADAGDTITDFTAGSDKLNLTDLFTSVGVTDTTGVNLANYLSVSTASGDTVVKFDPTGAANFGAAATLVTLQGAAATITDLNSLLANSDTQTHL